MANLEYDSKPSRFNTRRLVTSRPAQTADQFKITASYYERNNQFFGKLRVARTTDRRVIYPFEGADEIGPFSSGPMALEAARALVS
jgi:hypothetical protein